MKVYWLNFLKDNNYSDIARMLPTRCLQIFLTSWMPVRISSCNEWCSLDDRFWRMELKLLSRTQMTKGNPNCFLKQRGDNCWIRVIRYTLRLRKGQIWRVLYCKAEKHTKCTIDFVIWVKTWCHRCERMKEWLNECLNLCIYKWMNRVFCAFCAQTG